MDRYEFPLHATTPWAEIEPEPPGTHTCRYCDRPIGKRAVACEQHRGHYIQMVKMAKRQAARLVELARERKARTQ